MKGVGERILASATAASGVLFAFVCGLNAVPGDYGRWGVLLGAALALVYSLAAALALGTGTVVFAGRGDHVVLRRRSALVGGLTHVSVSRIVAGTIAVALAALSVLPRLAVRLARLPLATVPTTSEELQRHRRHRRHQRRVRARPRRRRVPDRHPDRLRRDHRVQRRAAAGRSAVDALGRAGRDRARRDGVAGPFGRRSRRADRVGRIGGRLRIRRRDRRDAGPPGRQRARAARQSNSASVR